MASRGGGAPADFLPGGRRHRSPSASLLRPVRNADGGNGPGVEGGAGGSTNPAVHIGMTALAPACRGDSVTFDQTVVCAILAGMVALFVWNRTPCPCRGCNVRSAASISSSASGRASRSTTARDVAGCGWIAGNWTRSSSATRPRPLPLRPHRPARLYPAVSSIHPPRQALGSAGRPLLARGRQGWRAGDAAWVSASTRSAARCQYSSCRPFGSPSACHSS